MWLTKLKFTNIKVNSLDYIEFLDQFSATGNETEAISFAKNLLLQEIMQQKHKTLPLYLFCQEHNECKVIYVTNGFYNKNLPEKGFEFLCGFTVSQDEYFRSPFSNGFTKEIFWHENLIILHCFEKKDLTYLFL